MGSLTIQIGGLSRAITPSDAKMQAVLADVVAATGGPVNGTNSQQVDHILLLIKRHLVEVANGYRGSQAISTAIANLTKLDLD
jgi:hypothetical protein